MMTAAATFGYVGVIPEDHLQRAWQLRDESGADAFSVTGDARQDGLSGDRLVGLTPLLEITDIGIEPDVRVSQITGSVRPRVLRSRLTLRADSAHRAARPGFSFCVDQAVTRSWRAGDVFHVARGFDGGLGLSVVRGDELIMAVGAVIGVPLGAGIRAWIPRDLIKDAEAVFRRVDREFSFSLLGMPIAIQAGPSAVIRSRGLAELGDYHAFFEHGQYFGLPGLPECVAIYRPDSCPAVAVTSSAQMMDMASTRLYTPNRS